MKEAFTPTQTSAMAELRAQGQPFERVEHGNPTIIDPETAGVLQLGKVGNIIAAVSVVANPDQYPDKELPTFVIVKLLGNEEGEYQVVDLDSATRELDGSQLQNWPIRNVNISKPLAIGRNHDSLGYTFDQSVSREQAWITVTPDGKICVSDGGKNPSNTGTYVKTMNQAPKKAAAKVQKRGGGVLKAISHGRRKS